MIYIKFTRLKNVKDTKKCQVSKLKNGNILEKKTKKQKKTKKTVAFIFTLKFPQRTMQNIANLLSTCTHSLTQNSPYPPTTLRELSE